MDEPIVRTDKVVKTFGRSIRALDGISLEFPKGIIYALLGPNGAGKTTLIRVLTTLIVPDSGTARVAGFDVVKEQAQVRERIGLAGQFAAVDSYLTGRENVEMVGRLYGLTRGEARKRAGEILEAINLNDAADRPVRTYSGGMQRRLDLAASLVGRPEILFLDEPTTGIDPRTRKDVWQLIQDLVGRGTTILLTTQYLEEADRLAEQIAVLDHGRLISEGTPTELKTRLGGAVIEVVVADSDRESALRALNGLVDGSSVQDSRIRLPAPDGSRSLVEVARRLEDSGIEADDLTLHRPTLDDVFLALTDHPAEVTEVDEPTVSRRRVRR